MTDNGRMIHVILHWAKPIKVKASRIVHGILFEWEFQAMPDGFMFLRYFENGEIAQSLHHDNPHTIALDFMDQWQAAGNMTLAHIQNHFS